MNAPADVLDGIEKGQLRLGILLGEYVAYVEASDSGKGFNYSVYFERVHIGGGVAPDLFTARERAEELLRMLSAKTSQ